MSYDAFSDVSTWVFDLDNTLYPPSVRLFDQIEALMVAYVMREFGTDEEGANRMRRDYWHNHGTTLAGLIENHGIDAHGFLEEVHDIDFSVLPQNPDLHDAITALPGRKIVYTNGSRKHAEQVTRASGLEALFDAMYGIEDAGFQPKPRRVAFDSIIALDGFEPQKAAMFEDDPRNLAAPHDLGMACVLVAPEPFAAAHIHHHTDDLTAFLNPLGNHHG